MPGHLKVVGIANPRGGGDNVGPWGPDEKESYAKSYARSKVLLMTTLRNTSDVDDRDNAIRKWFDAQSKRLDRLYRNLAMPVADMDKLHRQMLDDMATLYRFSGSKERARVTGNKNPARKKPAKKKRAKTSGRRNPVGPPPAHVIAKREPAGAQWVIRAVKADGAHMYYAGGLLTSQKHIAARYMSAKIAESVIDVIEDVFAPRLKQLKIKHFDIVQA